MQVASFIHACLEKRQEEGEAQPEASASGDTYMDVDSSSSLLVSQEYYSAVSEFTIDGEEVGSLPMEPGLAPETGASFEGPLCNL